MWRILAYALLLAASPGWTLDAAARAMSCMVLRNGTFDQLGECARRVPDGSYVVSAATLKKLDFDRWGLSKIVIRKEGYAYVRRNGHAMIVPTFDNAPDDFIDGLVRVRIGEKLGYANRRLKLVIPAVYDGAYPSANGRAWACVGCTSMSDGEHSWYRGGQTICLDQRGARRPQTECGQAGWVPPQLRE